MAEDEQQAQPPAPALPPPVFPPAPLPSQPDPGLIDYLEKGE
jgi:hypothetical protein